MKRSLFVGVSLLIITCIFVFGMQTNPTATLVAEKNRLATGDDFLLHLRVQNMDEGICILNSLQYVGEGSVEIYHQTPLISVSLLHKNHDYTGSTVSRNLRTGYIYHQEAIYLEAPKKGKHNLFVQAKFWVDGEEQIIEHVEELQFQ